MNVLPSEQLVFVWRSKLIFFSRSLFCCEISFCLLISVFRSLQMGQLGVVGKAPQTSSSKKEGKNKRHKIPLKIRTAILSSLEFSLNSIWGKMRIVSYIYAAYFVQLGFKIDTLLSDALRGNRLTVTRVRHTKSMFTITLRLLAFVSFGNFLS